MKRFLSLICLVLALLLLASCASAPKPERVSEEELTQLREEYPYWSVEPPPMASYNYKSLQSCPDYMKIAETTDVAVVEILGDLQMEATSSSPFGDARANEAIGAVSFCGLFIPCRIVEVLYGGEKLTAGDEIPLFFASNLTVSPEALECYHIGQRYLCFLTDMDGKTRAYKTENFYRAATHSSFYLSDGEVLLSIEDKLEWIDACSGMYLDTFERALPAMMDPGPDAEITDPTPGVETE